jgi:hypothetical protein
MSERGRYDATLALLAERKSQCPAASTAWRIYTAAEGTLRRHRIAEWWEPEWSEDEHPPCGWCTYDDRRVAWPCPDALGVMDTWMPATEETAGA